MESLLSADRRRPRFVTKSDARANWGTWLSRTWVKSSTEDDSVFTLGPTLSVVVFRVGYDFVNLMAADHSRLAYKAIPTDLEGQA